MELYVEKLISEIKKQQLTDVETQKIIHNLYRDFVINKNELKNLYKELNLSWNKDLDNMNKGQLKHIDNPRTRYFDFNKNGYEFYEKLDFDRKYLDYLIEQSKESTNYTTKLIEYIKELDILPLKYYVLEHIRIRNISAKLTDEDFDIVLEYEDEHHVGNLRELWRHAIVESNLENGKGDPDSMDVIEWVENFLGENLGVKYIQDEFENRPLHKLMFKIEEILVILDKKIANSIKMNFLIYNYDYLNKDEYDNDKGKLRSILNDLYKQLKNESVEDLRDFYEDNIEVINNFYSGYTSFLFSLLKEAK